MNRQIEHDEPVKTKRAKLEYSSFKLKRTDLYEGSFPVYKQPQELTSYSIDHNRHVWFDNREMVRKFV